MPGVGDLEERMDDLETTTDYDDTGLVERVDEVEDDVEVLDERVTAIESGDISAVTSTDRTEDPANETREQEKVTLTISDIEGLQDSMDVLRTSLSDSIVVLDESFENLVLSVDSLTMENDSLKTELEDLKNQVTSLTHTVENLRYTGDTPSSSRGSSSETGGRGGTSSSGTSGRGGSSSGSGTR